MCWNIPKLRTFITMMAEDKKIAKKSARGKEAPLRELMTKAGRKKPCELISRNNPIAPSGGSSISQAYSSPEYFWM